MEGIDDTWGESIYANNYQIRKQNFFLKAFYLTKLQRFDHQSIFCIRVQIFMLRQKRIKGSKKASEQKDRKKRGKTP